MGGSIPITSISRFIFLFLLQFFTRSRKVEMGGGTPLFFFTFLHVNLFVCCDKKYVCGVEGRGGGRNSGSNDLMASPFKRAI